MGRTKTRDQVLKKFKLVHGNRYDYSEFEYHGYRVKSLIICKEHGPFLQHSNSHSEGNGCPCCKKLISLKSFILKGSEINNKRRVSSFISECETIHPNLDFSKTVYVNKKTKVMVICKKHGDYIVTPRNLLRGHSCKECFWESKSEHWTLKGWEKMCKDGVSYFYLIQLQSPTERFLKCGITSTSIKKRKSQLPNEYTKKTLIEIKSSPKFCYQLEKELKKSFKHMQYIPELKFGGRFECLEYSQLHNIREFISEKQK